MWEPAKTPMNKAQNEAFASLRTRWLTTVNDGKFSLSR